MSVPKNGYAKTKSEGDTKMATTKKTTKQVHFIARYAHKTDKKLNGIVSYAVRSSNGKDIYCTTFIEGKASGCSCPARKPCYHMVQLEAREALRRPIKATVTESVDEMTMHVVRPVWNDWAARWDDPTTKKPIAMLGGVPYWNEQDGFTPHPEGKIWNQWMEEWVAPVPVADLMIKAPLTQNRAFSILR
jgi:hypothetical protein